MLLVSSNKAKQALVRPIGTLMRRWGVLLHNQRRYELLCKKASTSATEYYSLLLCKKASNISLLSQRIICRQPRPPFTIIRNGLLVGRWRRTICASQTTMTANESQTVYPLHRQSSHQELQQQPFFCCENCGWIDSYHDDSTGLDVCSSCYTQSQS
jgi:hypothetical protein